MFFKARSRATIARATAHSFSQPEQHPAHPRPKISVRGGERVTLIVKCSLDNLGGAIKFSVSGSTAQSGTRKNLTIARSLARVPRSAMFVDRVVVVVVVGECPISGKP